MSKNSNSSGRGSRKVRKGKFEPGAVYVIIKVATQPNSAFGAHMISQERILFSPQTHDDAVKFFQGVIASNQTNEIARDKILTQTSDDFMREFSNSIGGTHIPFHSASSFVEKMIELEIFKKAVLQ